MEIFSNKQLLSFQLQAVLSSMMKSRSLHPLSHSVNCSHVSCGHVNCSHMSCCHVNCGHLNCGQVNCPTGACLSLSSSLSYQVDTYGMSATLILLSNVPKAQD